MKRLTQAARRTGVIWTAARRMMLAAGIAVGLASQSCTYPNSSTITRFDTASSRRSLEPDVLIGDPIIRVDPQISRSSMPSPGPERRPMTARVRVQTVDGQPIPAGLRASRVFVYQDPWSWESMLSIVNMGNFGPSIDDYQSTTPGPEWNPSIPVDVVIELIDIEGNAHYPGVRNRTINTPM